MKKICMITTIPGSLRTFLVPEAKALHETGEFEIYFMARPDKEIEAQFPDFIHFIPIQMKRGIDLSIFSVIKRMKSVFKKERFDMVRYFTPNASCYASIAAKKAGVPVRIYSQWGILYVGFGGIKRFIFKRIEKLVCKNSTHIEVENRANLDFSHAEKLYPENKGYVIWNGSASGVSLERYDISKKEEWRKQVRDELGIPEDEFVFGFCGRQNKDKGLNELFEATEKILEKHPSAHLVLLGAANDSATLDPRLLQWAKQCPSVHFTGRVPDPERYYAAMDCYVMPSYREGFGMTVIEAECMAVPVIVSDITGHKGTMIPDKTGLCVKSHSTQAIYEAMIKMTENEETRLEMGRQGRAYAESSFEQKELLGRITEIRKEQAGLKTS